MNYTENMALVTSELSESNTQKSATDTIVKYAKQLTGAERCSLFLYNKEKDQLQSIYADGIKGKLSLKSNIGIVGYAFHKRQTVLENDTSTSNIFFKPVDTKTNYTTEAILAVPILKDTERIGVIEILNKKGGFSPIDQKYLESLADMLCDFLSLPVSQPFVKQIQAKTAEEKLQEKFDIYLDSRHLYLMEDGNAYYKILGMKREHFIPADQCYQLQVKAKKVDVYYYTGQNDFLSFPMLIKLDKNARNISISENVTDENFTSYLLEEDCNEEC